MNLVQGLKEYELVFRWYKGTYDLPPEWFARSDHFSFGVHNMGRFQHYVDTLKPNVETFYSGQDESDLFVSIAKLARPVISGLGEINWVEIKETADEIPDAKINFFYFLVPRIRAVKRELTARTLRFKDYETDVALVIGEQNEEIRFGEEPIGFYLG